MYVRIVEPGTLPEGYYRMELSGLPGSPKTAAAIEGKDVKTGEMWRVPIEPNPSNPNQSVAILVPVSVPYTRVVPADELAEEWAQEFVKERVG